ncbi:hypothetical protein [Cellulomonas sp. Y8]|uniref:hypothetical protein n=1 Tax=Cellulomonas sp. Y8 TaxID=2591145 RepID=UPI0011C867EA|nr:hypothetical protein [Cellulomonas sp. Y8]
MRAAPTTNDRPRPRTRRVLRALAPVLGAVVAVAATAAPAAAGVGTFPDDTAEPGVAATTDITRYALRLDGSTVKATIFFRAWDPALVDGHDFSASIETTGDAMIEYQLLRYGTESTKRDRTVLLRAGDDGGAVAGCPVTFTASAATRSVSLAVAAACVQDPATARLAVFAAPVSGGTAPDFAPGEEGGYSPWVTAGPSGPDVPTLPVYRFWSPRFDNAHFFTTNADEAARLTASDRNWVAEGQPFSAFAADGTTCAAGTTAVHRFYSMRFRSHFFTASAAEKNAIVAGDKNWAYEGVAYCATTTAQPGTTPLYRFWSPTFGKHHFTTDAAEARRLDVDDPNWDAEGIAYYVAP